MRWIDADVVLRSLKDSVRRVLIQAPTVDAGMELERQRKTVGTFASATGCEHGEAGE